MRSPSGQRAAHTVAAPVSLLDLMPTVLELAGIRPPERIQGESLVPQLTGRAPPKRSERRALFAELHPVAFGAGWNFHARAVRLGTQKLIRRVFLDGRTEIELYDLAQDPGERHDLYPIRRGTPGVRMLEERLDQFMAQAAAYHPGRGPANRIQIDAEIQERLRALGYAE